jgi:hypothetical protein
LKEEEAKTKWCPHVRGTNASNSYGGERMKAAYTCIASDCMMWVQDSSFWAKDGHRIATESDEFNNYLTPEDGGFEIVCEGHCGLVK